MAPSNGTAAGQHHAVVVPLAAQGHINPLMRLCKLLVSRHSFTVTFVNVGPIHDRLLHLEQQKQQQKTVSDDNGSPNPPGRIRLAHVPLPSLDLSNDFRFSLEHFMEALQGISEGLESLVRSLSPPATCIISDLGITSPTQLIADRLGIPRVMFFPSSQSFHMFKYHVLSGSIRIDRAIAMAQECNLESYGDPAHEGQLEGLVPLVKRDLACYRHVDDDTEFLYHFVTRELKMSYERSHAIVVNSFRALEDDAIEAFTKLASKPTLYTAGPLIEDLTSGESSTSLWVEDEGCMEWLDKQPPNTVLYISFGSVTLVSKEQFEEVLSGIESSNQRFLWAFRPDLVEGGACAIPDGFLERTRDRGYVTSWTPQLSVLQHSSVGGFLTHCGWNSTMEAIASGVPMLCWPYFADQFLDAKYISELWRVGLPFQRPPADAGAGAAHVIPKREIQRVIHELMQGEEGKVLRENAIRYKEAAWKCHKKGGSSQASMEAFVKSLA